MNKNLDNSLELREELKQLNNSIAFTPTADKGFWTTLGNVLAVASADIIAAGAGAYAVKEVAGVVGIATGGTGAAVVAGTAAVIAGAGGSVAAGKALNASAPPPTLDPNSVKYPFKISNVVGYMHNDIIIHHFIKNEISIDEWTMKNIDPTYVKEVLLVVNSKEFKMLCDKIEKNVVCYSEEHKNVNQLIADMQATFKFSGNMVTVWEAFFKKYQDIENTNDIVTLVNSYNTFVSQQVKLTVEEKLALCSSFSVAQYSPFLWLVLTKE